MEIIKQFDMFVNNEEAYEESMLPGHQIEMVEIQPTMYLNYFNNDAEAYYFTSFEKRNVQGIDGNPWYEESFVMELPEMVVNAINEKKQEVHNLVGNTVYKIVEFSTSNQPDGSVNNITLKVVEKPINKNFEWMRISYNIRYSKSSWFGESVSYW
jgi:hypothetical protein